MIPAVVLWMLGVCSTAYFVRYCLTLGRNNTFVYFWLLLGIVCIAGGCVCMVFHVRQRALPKPLVTVACGVSAVCLLVFLVVEGILIVHAKMQPQPGAEYVIVLGARVDGTRIMRNLQNRLDAAIDYLEENPDAVIIVSGGRGRGEDITEADAMGRYLEEHGVGKEKILRETRSKNTDQNLSYSAELMDSKESRVVIVTSDFHIYRAKKIATKQGYTQVSGIGAETTAFTVPNNFVREAVAVIKYKLCGQI